MLTCFKLSCLKIFVFFYCTLVAVDDIFAASFQIPESIFNTDTASEPGFNLDEEDMAKFHIWPTGTLPYYIDDFSFDKVLRDKIRMFLDGVNRLTVLHFVEISRPPIDETTRWVLFINRKGLLDCADLSFKNFTNKGVQRVVLGYHCLNSDENLADIVLSLVGVPAQHNSPNRDKHVVIQENNILRDKLYLFEKLKDDQWLFHNLMYDIDSAGHYGPYKYTKNGNITVQQRGDYYFHSFLRSQISKPKEKGFSSSDILKIAMLYNYIVRERGRLEPECSKLFSPGSKLSAVRLEETNHKIKPRNKPRQYMGKKEEQNDEDENNNDHNSTNYSKDQYYEDYGDYENDDKNNDNIENSKKLDENSILSNVDSGDVNNRNNDKNNEDDYSKKDNENDTEVDYYNEKDGNTDNKEKKKRNVNGQSSNDMDDEDDIMSNEEKNYNDNSNVENKENLNQNSEGYEYVTKSYTTINTTRKNRRPLAHKIDHLKKQKLLGQSDYETGDEGNKRYIHEKNI